jgi:hypothetical protein
LTKEVIEIKAKTMILGFIAIVVAITLFKDYFMAFANFLINPEVNIPDNIPLPGGK